MLASSLPSIRKAGFVHLSVMMFENGIEKGRRKLPGYQITSIVTIVVLEEIRACRYSLRLPFKVVPFSVRDNSYLDRKPHVRKGNISSNNS